MRAKIILAWGCLAVLFLALGGCGQRSYYRLLAKDSNFARDDTVEIEFTYDFDDPRLAQLDAKWNLRETAGAGDTQSQALNLLHWLCAHTVKGNPQSLPEGLRMDADALLDWSFDQPGNGPNGKHLSVILSECLLAVGVRAYVLWGFPKVFNGQKACMVQAWLPEEDRWILLDPSFGTYFTDRTGRILSAPEARKRLGSGELRDASMARNMYYFNRAQDTKVGMLDAAVEWVFLLPAGYEPAEKGICATYESFWK